MTMKTRGTRAAAWAGLGALGLLFALSLWAHAAGDVAFVDRCPLPYDVDYDATPCFLALDGLRVSLSLGLLSGALATLAAVLVAAAARVAGGAAERWVMRMSDAVFSLPDVLLLMVMQHALSAALSDSGAYRRHALALTVVALAAVSWPGAARMVRDRAASVEREDYVAAARALGGSRVHVLVRHVWPALRGYVLVIFLQRVPAAILAESVVSYVGIGDPSLLSLGRYLAKVTRDLQYVSAAQFVLPAWGLLVLAVLSATLAARALAAER